MSIPRRQRFMAPVKYPADRHGVAVDPYSPEFRQLYGWIEDKEILTDEEYFDLLD